ncbi:MAG: aldo/keto reductase [Rhizobiaceae bacterium]
MKQVPLGRTGISVSRICLGTMTWGSQNSEAEGHQQMDYAMDHGVSFWDTAEMYPTTPRSAETTGRTEEIIGSWFSRTGRRHEVVLATKVTGEGNKDIRGGAMVNGRILREALEGSLSRLRSDHVDLYQLHWPNRGSYHFRKSWTYNATRQARGIMEDHVRDLLETVGQLQKEGKIRAFGLSNETVWGTAQFLRLSEKEGLPRIATVQNEYSLLHRLFDTDFAELSHHEDVGLLAFSPLAAGLLSGKYLDGTVQPGTRMSMQPDLNGRSNEMSGAALKDYAEVAKRHGLDLAQMAIAFCLTRPFMTAPIIGATSLEQLKTNIAAADLSLSDAVMADIASVFRRYPLPM